MAVSEFISQHRTGGTKGTAPFAYVTAALLLQPCFLFSGTGYGGGGFIQLTGIFRYGWLSPYRDG